MRFRVLARAIAALLYLRIFVAEAASQSVEEPVGEVSHVALLLANVGVGAAVAGLGSALHDKPVRRAVAQGAFAGAVVFAGKWIVSENRDATNLFGRSVAAAGSSGILDAATGRPLLTMVILPYGPFRLHIDRRAGRIRPKLDLATSAVLIAEFRRKEQRFQTKLSAISGVPTFKVDSAKRSGDIGGSQIAGVVRYRPATRFIVSAPDTRTMMVGHELVHVVQADANFNLFAAPLEAALLRRMPLGKKVHGFIDLGVHVLVWSGINHLIPYNDRPWEREAVSLAGR